MNRLKTNKQILLKLNEFINDHSEMRFIQALWAMRLVDNSDRFYEESSVTLSKMDKLSFSPEIKDEIFICECGNLEHQLIFMFENHGVFMYTHLNKLPLWQRIKYAIKYIFGYTSKYGAFDEFIFNKEDAQKLQKIVDKLGKSCVL